MTRPDLFRTYLTEQIGLPTMAWRSKPRSRPSRDINIEGALSNDGRLLRDVFDTSDLATMDDASANGTLRLLPGAPEPLALFGAARIDYSLRRLYHCAGTNPEHFQNFVIFTVETSFPHTNTRRLRRDHAMIAVPPNRMP